MVTENKIFEPGDTATRQHEKYKAVSKNVKLISGNLGELLWLESALEVGDIKTLRGIEERNIEKGSWL